MSLCHGWAEASVAVTVTGWGGVKQKNQKNQKPKTRSRSFGWGVTGCLYKKKLDRVVGGCHVWVMVGFESCPSGGCDWVFAQKKDLAGWVGVTGCAMSESCSSLGVGHVRVTTESKLWV